MKKIYVLYIEILVMTQQSQHRIMGQYDQAFHTVLL